MLVSLALCSFGEYFQDGVEKNNVISHRQGNDMLMKLPSEKTEAFDLVVYGGRQESKWLF